MLCCAQAESESIRVLADAHATSTRVHAEATHSTAQQNTA